MGSCAVGNRRYRLTGPPLSNRPPMTLMNHRAPLPTDIFKRGDLPRSAYIMSTGGRRRHMRCLALLLTRWWLSSTCLRIRLRGFKLFCRLFQQTDKQNDD
jgi:hypothetical protein